MRRNTLNRNPDGTPKVNQLQMLTSMSVRRDQIGKLTGPSLALPPINPLASLVPLIKTSTDQNPIIVNVDQLDPQLSGSLKSYVELSKNTQERIIMLTSKKESVAENIGRLKSHQTSLEKKSKELGDKILEYQKEIATKEEQISELGKHIALFIGLKEKVSGIDSAESSDIVSKLEDVSAKESKLKGSLELNLGVTSDKLSQAKLEVSNLDQQILELNNQIKIRSEDLQKFEKIVEQLEKPNNFSLTQQTVDDLEDIKTVVSTFKQLPELASSIKSKEEELVRLTELLKSKDVELSKLNELEPLTKKKAELDSLKEILSDMNDKFKSFLEKFESLSKELKDKKSSIDEKLEMLNSQKIILEEIEKQLQ